MNQVCYYTEFSLNQWFSILLAKPNPLGDYFKYTNAYTYFRLTESESPRVSLTIYFRAPKAILMGIQD